jgi:hypothetical protein
LINKIKVIPRRENDRVFSRKINRTNGCDWWKTRH